MIRNAGCVCAVPGLGSLGRREQVGAELLGCSEQGEGKRENNVRETQPRSWSVSTDRALGTCVLDRTSVLRVNIEQIKPYQLILKATQMGKSMRGSSHETLGRCKGSSRSWNHQEEDSMLDMMR